MKQYLLVVCGTVVPPLFRYLVEVQIPWRQRDLLSVTDKVDVACVRFWGVDVPCCFLVFRNCECDEIYRGGLYKG